MGTHQAHDSWKVTAGGLALRCDGERAGVVSCGKGMQPVICKWMTTTTPRKRVPYHALAQSRQSLQLLVRQPCKVVQPVNPGSPQSVEMGCVTPGEVMKRPINRPTCLR